jgi:hypothetical protein
MKAEIKELIERVIAEFEKEGLTVDRDETYESIIGSDEIFFPCIAYGDDVENYNTSEGFWVSKSYHSEQRINTITKAKNVFDRCNIQEVEQEGGGEGGGEYCYSVWSIFDQFVRFEYSYYSYNGYDMDGAEDTLRIVTPKEKTIIVYE